MERKLLLLGLLRKHDMYGYQINDLIDAHLGSSINLTKPTAYRLLHNMAEQGWISYHEEKVGNRPTRRIYVLTENGESQFHKLLRDCLGQYEQADYSSVVCLAFLDALPTEQVLPLLGKRRTAIVELLESLHSSDSHHGGFQLTIDHQVRHLETDLIWLSEVISHLESTELGNEADEDIQPLSKES